MVTGKKYLASNNTTATVALIYSLVCLSMTLDVQFRFVLIFGATLLALIFYLIFPLLLKNFNIFIDKRFIILLLITFLICFEGFYAASFNGQMPVTFIFISLFSVFSVLVIYLMLIAGSKKIFFYYFQIPLLIFGIFSSLFHFILGIEVLENQNSYSNLFIPTLFYFALISRSNFLLLFIVFVFTITISLVHEARLVSIMATIIMFSLPLSDNKLIIRFSALLALALTFALVYYTVNFDQNLNEILSNRILIWQYYLAASSQNFYIGFGYIDPVIAESAADYVELMIQRGASEHYGTQSMLFRYIYDNGFIATVLFYLFIFKEFFRGSPHGLLAVYGYLPTLLESIKFGTPSIFGCIFMVTFLMSYASREKI